MRKRIAEIIKAACRWLLRLDRDLRAAQPLIAGIAAAVGGSDAGSLVTIEQLCVSILGDVIGAVADVETDRTGAAVTLAAQTVADIRRLTAILHPRLATFAQRR